MQQARTAACLQQIGTSDATNSVRTRALPDANIILAEGAIELSVTLSGGALFAS